ncbi:protein kinase [Brevibacillus sp. 7WMA2]|uniref:serine/threonine protein kinase n=1 Tax=Brevibacillus TaxID=55080 RepID=UPI000BDB8186|nr:MULTISPECIES: protein kinase [Brevibacillus]MBA4534295.1 protein kinase [Brevibacillus halotolerans]MCR8997024.1 protein kinase [Brevibacillus laterosporus]PCN43039.1 serine/threonine protein kinase [Brevibacillus laterosporus]QIC07039.1 protein kinase [Brevibacillus sp. 7WMA2]WPS87945.1 protein kinase [Brevibacillus halotolerans]
MKKMTVICKTMYSNSLLPDAPHYFTGKWHHQTYSVVKELGRGANGVVYLVLHEGKKVAIKLGADSIDLLMEANVLKSLQSHNQKIGPNIYDVDDMIVKGKVYAYYAMEYIEGERLDHSLKRVGKEWLILLCTQILSHLQIIHELGYVFGDLKPENVIVVQAGKQVCLIDFGGVTKSGHAVRQFTEEYDRATWQAGDRKADATYDLFSLAIMMIKLTIEKEKWATLPVSGRHVQKLYDIIRDNELLAPYRPVLGKALDGKYPTALHMKAELLQAFRQKSETRGDAPNTKKPGEGIGSKIIGGIFVASMLLLAGSLYYVWM